MAQVCLLLTRGGRYTCKGSDTALTLLQRNQANVVTGRMNPEHRRRGRVSARIDQGLLNSSTLVQRTSPRADSFWLPGHWRFTPPGQNKVPPHPLSPMLCEML